MFNHSSQNIPRLLRRTNITIRKPTKATNKLAPNLLQVQLSIPLRIRPFQKVRSHLHVDEVDASNGLRLEC
jgi:hypothetical protein